MVEPTAQATLNDVQYGRTTVPGRGGELAIGRWGQGDTIVVASHGITANHLSWDQVAREVVARSDGDVSIVGVDHRGRAGSAGLPGPFGLAAHADDLISVMDALDLETATITGHSMGGFVITLAAERHPQRVDQLVAVDGGLPFALEFPDDIDPEEAVAMVIGPALARLDQRWATEDDYVNFFIQHPAFQPPGNQWWPAAEAYVRYDAVSETAGDGGNQIRSSVNKEAVVVDGGAAIVEPETSSAIKRITHPTTLLWAPRGLLDQTPGLYTDQQMSKAAQAHGHLCPHLVDNTNHYTIVIGANGAAATAQAIVAAAVPQT